MKLKTLHERVQELRPFESRKIKATVIDPENGKEHVQLVPAYLFRGKLGNGNQLFHQWNASLETMNCRSLSGER